MEHRETCARLEMNTSECVRYSELGPKLFKYKLSKLDEDELSYLKRYILERLAEDKDAMKLYEITMKTSILDMHSTLHNRHHTELIKAKAQQYMMMLQGGFRFLEEMLSRGSFQVKGLADIQMMFLDMHRGAIMKLAEKSVSSGDGGQVYSIILKVLDQLDPKTRIVVTVLMVAVIYILAIKFCGPEIAQQSVQFFAEYMGCETNKAQPCLSAKDLGMKVIGGVTGYIINGCVDDTPTIEDIKKEPKKCSEVAREPSTPAPDGFPDMPNFMD